MCNPGMGERDRDRGISGACGPVSLSELVGSRLSESQFQIKMGSGTERQVVPTLAFTCRGTHTSKDLGKRHKAVWN